MNDLIREADTIIEILCPVTEQGHGQHESPPLFIIKKHVDAFKNDATFGYQPSRLEDARVNRDDTRDLDKISTCIR